MTIATSIHPEYMLKSSTWDTYRRVSEGGTTFIESYLKKFSTRESDADFTSRKEMTPVPYFAGAAVTDVKNAIFQRMADISRAGGSITYQEAIAGDIGGVDLCGSTMNSFMGQSVLPELLFMGKVGIYVDMPAIDPAASYADTKRKHPYIYSYRVENIRNWDFSNTGTELTFNSLLLQEEIMQMDKSFGLPNGLVKRFRLLQKTPAGIAVRFFNEAGEQVDSNNDRSDDISILELDRIPFVLLELNQSLLQNICNHQIALLNMESSDVMYSLKANFPFYTEQFDSRTQSAYLKQPEQSDTAPEGNEIEVGSVQGRRYAKDLDRPDFIHPSPEPLLASIQKQKCIKDDIRMLINLALSNIQPRFASAESKELDQRGLESGLSYIGLVCESAEKSIANLWSLYENTPSIATVTYPERYSLKSDAERLTEAGKLGDLMQLVPSKTYSKEIAKRVTGILLGSTVSNETLQQTFAEIDSAKSLTADPDIIASDVEKGLVSVDLASQARGYPQGEAEKAKKDHADRVARINASQSPGARGVEDDPEAAKAEKKQSQEPDIQPDSKKPVRGEA